MAAIVIDFLMTLIASTIIIIIGVTLILTTFFSMLYLFSAITEKVMDFIDKWFFGE